MKRFAVVLLSVLLVLLPGCTKPVTESGVQSTESGTAESTDASLAEKTDDSPHKHKAVMSRKPFPPA